MKLTLSLILFSSLHLQGQRLSELRYIDKIRIKEAIQISAKFGEDLFKGYNKVPFILLLVTDSTEFLINHPDPSTDFMLLGKNTILDTYIDGRKRMFNQQLLATFPAVNEQSCIVVGTPENTHKNSSEWVITLLHEHFHQYQYIQPDYLTSVNQLDLSGGTKPECGC